MENRNHSHIAIGIAMLLVGIILLNFQLVPDLRRWIDPFASWPFIIAAFGLFLIFYGYVAQKPDAISGGCFFIGLGGIFTWQIYTHDWASWAYMWTLFPAFSGAGTILSSFIRPAPQQALLRGLREILLSAVMFFLFSTLLGGKNWIGPLWPVLIILAGLLMLTKPLFSRRSSENQNLE